MNLEKNRPHFVAGIYTAYSDVIGKRLGFSDGFLAPYLIHNLDPLKAGIAGCLISFTANKIYDLIIPRLSEHAQKSELAKFYIHTFCYIAVGTAFGAGSALLIPAAGITATAGIALGISSAVGTYIDGAATLFNVSEYGLKNLPPIPFAPISTKDLILTCTVTPFFITFSDTLIKCFVSPQSLLAGLLLHNVQGVMRSFLLSSLISTSALILSRFLTSQLPAPHANSNLIKFPIWIASHILVGAAAGLIATVPSYLGFQTKVCFSLCLLIAKQVHLVILPWALAGSLNLTTGIALGIACVAAYPLTLLIQRITKIFYAKSSLLTYIQISRRINKNTLTDIKEKGNQLHQATLLHRGIYFPVNYPLVNYPLVNHPLVIHPLVIQARKKKENVENLLSYVKDNNIQEMDKEKFKNWRLKNLTFWEGVTEGKSLNSLESQKPTDENIAGICYALKNPRISGILVFQHQEEQIILVDSFEYPEIHVELPEDLKTDQEFNARALVAIGNRHLQVMPETMKTEELIVKCAYKNPHLIYDIDQKILKDILPAFVGHSKFGLAELTIDWEEKWSTVVKLSAKACDVTEKKRVKRSMFTLWVMKQLQLKINNTDFLIPKDSSHYNPPIYTNLFIIPKPVHKMILFYTLIP